MTRTRGTGEAVGPLTKLLSVRDVAEILGVPVQTLYDWRVRGDGPAAIRIGRHLRYETADVTRWIAERKSASQRGGWWAQR